MHQAAKTIVNLCVVVAFAGCGKGSTEPAPAKEKVSAGERAKTAEVNEAEKAAVEKIAKAALSAYRDKNIERLADLGPPSARERTVFIEPRNPNYERLLGDSTWRMRALKAWDGELKGFRIGPEIAQVKFAEHPDDPKQVIAIELLKTDGTWRFHDLVEQDRKLYVTGKLMITLPPNAVKLKDAPK